MSLIQTKQDQEALIAQGVEMAKVDLESMSLEECQAKLKSMDDSEQDKPWNKMTLWTLFGYNSVLKSVRNK